MAGKQKWSVVSKKDFLGQGDWSREYYEGLLVVNHRDQGYDLGVELPGEQILKVDTASAEEVKDRVQYWGARLEDIRQEYGFRDNRAAEYYGWQS
ncbi:MAG: hypothetical protein GX295_01915 [Syntrophomonadaceae bacterium]|nr:hypothetical protein [Syntrophomonadaceae bacterium]